VAPGGRGLGLVAGDFDGRGRLSLFVANDTDANFFFQSAPDGRGFRETALRCGLAYGDQGRAQSGMGVAAGDFDEDGRLDLLVTNFAREYNALYLQALPGLFSDEIRRSGMAQASLAVLGFGTQALDGDLDGRLDLVVSNGHIQNERAYTGDEYQMPPQFFHGLGGGRFAEAPADGLGPYFAGRYLGRSMARLDWNRDRREDVAISHLDVATSLLLNATANAGHSVALRLVGTTSSRDAIGAIATLQVQGRTIVRHLTAGDGFQASNQRLLVFGLGEETRVDGLTISWPSGLQQQFADLPVDSELLLVEKQPRPLVTGQPQN
jgi:hypothetical protein